MSDKVYFFDTTLRDGEQCPGASMNHRQKLEVARQLERLGMDVIEAGFPCISDGDFESVHSIATEIKNCKIAGLARCVFSDIEAAAKALAPAGDRARIHIVLATSPLHMEYKLKKTPDEVLQMAIAGTAHARKFAKDVEFSAEDATRSELPFLAKIVEEVIKAGATVVNIPDTVGYTTPDEYYNIIKYLKDNVSNIDQAIISVHCHDDLGLSVANSLAAIRAGARQVEGTINGIGERAGNTALEEVIMNVKTRSDLYRVDTNIVTSEIVKTSKLVARMSGLQVQRSKAIVGENAFAHSSGIHQHGILSKRETYEIIDPIEIGWGATQLPLTKHSGRAAMVNRLQHLGHNLSDEEINRVFEQFKKIGDTKKFVYDDDLSALVDDSLNTGVDQWELGFVQFMSGSYVRATATIGLNKEGKEYSDCQVTKSGAVDAVFKAIDRITKEKGTLLEYTVHATSEGKDSVGEVTVIVDFGGSKPVVGKGASSDVIEASARAYLSAINKHLRHKDQPNITFNEESLD